VLTDRLQPLPKYALYVAVLFGVAYAVPGLVDGSRSLTAFTHSPLVESAISVVLGQEPPDSGVSREENQGGRVPPATQEPAVEAAPPAGPVIAEPPRAPSLPHALPESARPVYPAGYVAGGRVEVTVPDVLGEAPAGVERQLAELRQGSCVEFGDWQPVELVNVVPDGTCARYRTVVAAETGDPAASPAAEAVVRRDDTAPAPAEVKLSETDDNGYAAGSTFFYRAAAGQEGTFTVTARGEDPESGVEQVAFPGLGDTPAQSETGPKATATYAWSSSGSSETGAEGDVVTTNGAGSTSETPLRLVGDGDAPTGGFISYAGGRHRDGAVEISTGHGDDAVSGLDEASGVVEEQDRRLVHGRCRGDWGAWHTAAPDGSPGRAACVRYRFTVSDNVGNETTYTSDAVAKVVDALRPSAALVAPTAGATVGGAVTLSAEAKDRGFGVASVRFQLRGHGRSSCHGRWCTLGTATTAPYTVAWDTTAFKPGDYRLRVVVVDRAGNRTKSAPVAVTVASEVEPLPPDDEGNAEEPEPVPDDQPSVPPADEPEDGEDDDAETAGPAVADGGAVEPEEAPADEPEAPPPAEEEDELLP
jgi:hypothetical protein